MTKVLVINSSPNGPDSVSAKLAGEFVARLMALQPDLKVQTRNVGDEPQPHLTNRTLAGVRGTPATLKEHAARLLSDDLIEEVVNADVLVIGAPMINFGISSALKTSFDHILRAGVTFRYTADGPEGLIRGKRAIVTLTRGGAYSEGPAAAMDAQEPHLRTMLSFIGITDVTFIRAERLALPDLRDQTILNAVHEVHHLAGRLLSLAA